MNIGKIKGRHVYRGAVILINLAVVTVILTILIVFFKTETASSTARNREQFEAVTSAVGQTIVGMFETHQQIVNSLAAYINSGEMTMEEAISYIERTQGEGSHMYHLVWTDDATGLSNRAGKLDASDFTVDYSGIMSATSPGECLITVMSRAYDESGDDLLHATRAFNNPTDAKSTVAFYEKVWLLRDGETGGETGEAILMLLANVEDLRAEYSFPKGIFEETDTAIIDKNSGYYVVPHGELKNTSFYEYIREYNDIDYNGIAELKERIATEETVAETFLNYKGEKTRFIISSVEGSDDWALVSFLPLETLEKMSDNYLWNTTITVVSLILLLLVCDMLYFIIFNRKLEKSLENERRSREEAVIANRSKTDFLSTMSHDIRTPLNAIIGLTTLTKEKPGDAVTVERNLQKIEQSGQHLLTLINDILDISKIESGRLLFNDAPFSFDETEGYLRSLCLPMAETKGVNLEIITDNPAGGCLLGDKLRIYQVMVNILTNAVKYTPEGGSVKAVLRAERKSDSLAEITYTVADTGIGMSPEFMEHMYENFSRAKDGRIDKIQGTGLGLAICRKIVDAMNGTIQCESRVNEGTTFTVLLELPFAEEQEKETSGEAITVRAKHILVAEDNDLNWEILSEMLELENITCRRAENGQEAVNMLQEAAESREYDLVLMDIQMPVMTGLEATKVIRESEEEYLKSIPIIALTADAFSENVDECLHCGMNSHVAKPINMEILLREMNRVLERKE